MLFYVSCCGEDSCLNRSKKITRHLQRHDIENCYLNPKIMFLHLFPGYIDKDDFTELCLDVLQNCDKLIVVGNRALANKTELEFAELVGMEVIFIESPNT